MSTDFDFDKCLQRLVSSGDLGAAEEEYAEFRRVLKAAAMRLQVPFSVEEVGDPPVLEVVTPLGRVRGALSRRFTDHPHGIVLFDALDGDEDTRRLWAVYLTRHTPWADVGGKTFEPHPDSGYTLAVGNVTLRNLVCQQMRRLNALAHSYIPTEHPRGS